MKDAAMTSCLIPLCAALALVIPLDAQAASQNVSDLPGGHYVLDKRHANVIAKVMHMGVSLYVVRFNEMDASFEYDPAHPEAARVQASVDPASFDVNADYSKKFAEDFLSASRFPKMSFAATGVQKGAGNGGTMTGDLTFMGVTKPVTFDVTFVATGRSLLPPFRQTAGFSATMKFKRSDFGSTYLNNVVGDEVTVEVEGEFDRQ
ncbi:MAG: YceI family protein [Caulobacterales bacterium]